jgi:hypothetical protein
MRGSLQPSQIDLCVMECIKPTPFSVERVLPMAVIEPPAMDQRQRFRSSWTQINLPVRMF